MLYIGFFLNTQPYMRASCTRALVCVLGMWLTVAGCSGSHGTRETKASSADLAKINAVIDTETFRLTREDLTNADRFTTLLQVVVSTYYGTGGHLVGSSAGLRMIETDISAWLKGTEKDETVLRNLCRDPRFNFKESTWTIAFNVLKPSGGVDKWKMIGEHNTQTNRHTITEIEISSLKPDGTFVCALLS